MRKSPFLPNRPLKVAILGSSGAVGSEILKILEERAFPVSELVLLSSERSEGKIIKWKGEEIITKKVTKDKSKKDNIKKPIVKNDIDNFDVYWPKILEEAKSILTPRKYSYLTLVKPEVIDSNNLILYIDSENEYLISELRKSDEIIELIKSNVTQKMGVEVTVAIQPHEGLQNNNQTSKDVQSNISEIFDVESID